MTTHAAILLFAAMIFVAALWSYPMMIFVRFLRRKFARRPQRQPEPLAQNDHVADLNLPEDEHGNVILPKFATGGVADPNWSPSEWDKLPLPGETILTPSRAQAMGLGHMGSTQPDLRAVDPVSGDGMGKPWSDVDPSERIAPAELIKSTLSTGQTVLRHPGSSRFVKGAR